MSRISETFLQEAESKAFDREHRRKIKFNIGKYNTAVENGLQEFSNHELARERASYIKEQSVFHLDKYLLEFEQNFEHNGGKVIWAKTAEDALVEISRIFDAKAARRVVKSKTMTTEEIHLNEFLEKKDVEVVETDLGEYIVQLAGQKPYHIVTPAMHMSKKDIADLFVKKLHIEPTDDARELTLTARRILREKYLNADIGITGGNFLIADVGGIAITENEGNARLSTTFPKVHIAVVGIEKLIPAFTDLGLMWQMLCTSGTGQMLTVYNTVLTGPRKAGEQDGPEEMYVVLLDNGRSALLADVAKRAALKCIRCGACLNTCPVYKNIGGHTYKTTYSGPIGAVISPQFMGLQAYKHLSYASSLCGACTSVCPVKIPIHELLLLNRNQSVKENAGRLEKFGFQVWKVAMLNRSLMNSVRGGVKSAIINLLFPAWRKRRSNVKLAPKSFNELWKERKA